MISQNVNDTKDLRLQNVNDPKESFHFTKTSLLQFLFHKSLNHVHNQFSMETDLQEN